MTEPLYKMPEKDRPSESKVLGTAIALLREAADCSDDDKEEAKEKRDQAWGMLYAIGWNAAPALDPAKDEED
jgi:hypothetical protein